MVLAKCRLWRGPLLVRWCPAIVLVLLAALWSDSAGLPGATPARGFPGTNGLIVFSSDVDGDREIFVIRADGTGIRKLTDNSGVADDAPVWSADGSRIAFTTNRDGQDEIYVMDASGANQVNVSNNPARDQAPAWSPTGSRIAFHSDRGQGANEFEIWVMGADGSSPVKLTENPGFQNANPAWSPDGTKILFHSGRDLDPELYWMSPDGSGQTRLTSSPNDDVEASWSPDGGRIAFQSLRNGNYDIWVMSASPLADAVPVTDHPGPDTVPAWSPEGDRIVFQANRGSSNDLFFVSPSGAALGGVVPTPGQERSPDWQPVNGLPPLKPELGILASAASAGTTIATVSAAVNPHGRATTVRFEYGTTPAYGQQTAEQAIGAGRAPVIVSATLRGLAEGTTHHYRVVATNAIGSTVGPDQVFGTAVAPVVVTLGPTGVGERSVVARGRIDANELPGLSYHFDYGRTTRYGSRTASVPIAGSQLTEVRARIDGLRPSTRYHYRLVVEGEAEPRAGGDQGVRTAGPDEIEVVFTPKLLCGRNVCTMSRASLVVKLRDGRTGKLLGSKARRALRVSVRTSATRDVLTFGVRSRLKTESVTGRRVSLRFSDQRGSLSLGNVTPVFRGIRFGVGAFVDLRVTRKGAQGVVHRLQFVSPGRRVRKECVLAVGSSRPRDCRRLS